MSVLEATPAYGVPLFIALDEPPGVPLFMVEPLPPPRATLPVAPALVRLLMLVLALPG